MSQNSHINPLLLPSTPKSANADALAPPPELQYQTKEEMYASAQKWAKDHGYAISVGHSTTSNGENRTTYICDRSGAYPERSDGKLGTTKITQCPFNFTGNFYKKKGYFQIKIKDPSHNHPASEDPSFHSVHRRLTTEQINKVQALTDAGVPPLKIKTTLVQESSAPIAPTLNTIYNARNHLRRNQLEGRSPIEALIYEIRKREFYHSVQTSDSHMTSLFFAHPNSLILAKRFPSIILLDCTYKTNKYKMPLLHFVGVNSSRRNFSIAFCFLPAEKEANYTWALEQLFISMDKISPSVMITDNEKALINSISSVFPNTSHHLCTWHISKNIDAKCKNSFKSDEEWTKFKNSWKKFINSSTQI